MRLFKNDKKVEISIFQTELTRLQGLVQIMDKKLAFIFIIYSVIFGFYFKKLNIIISLKNNCVNFVLVLLIFILLIYGFYKIYLTIFPQTNKNEKPLLFFGYIASLGLKEYKKEMLSITNKKFMEEIIEQNHTLSTIVNIKIKNLKEVINILIIIIFISIIYIGINFELLLGKQ